MKKFYFLMAMLSACFCLNSCGGDDEVKNSTDIHV